MNSPETGQNMSKSSTIQAIPDAECPQVRNQSPASAASHLAPPTSSRDQRPDRSAPAWHSDRTAGCWNSPRVDTFDTEWSKIIKVHQSSSELIKVNQRSAEFIKVHHQIMNCLRISRILTIKINIKHGITWLIHQNTHLEILQNSSAPGHPGSSPSHPSGSSTVGFPAILARYVFEFSIC